MSTPKSSKHLASKVASTLKAQNGSAPALKLLTNFFQTLYSASLRTEEGQAITCHIVFLNPDAPDPTPPRRTPKDRWHYVPLRDKLAFTVPNLVKISKASDPRTSSFAVYPDENAQLRIWGFVDQGNKYHDFVNFNTTSTHLRPGDFQASIAGIGHLIAYNGFQRIAELKIDVLVTEAHDVLRQGPVRTLIRPALDQLCRTVFAAFDARTEKERKQWTSIIRHEWIATLCRILLRVKGYHHGGAILVTAEADITRLQIKYELDYARLRTALVHKTRATIHQHRAFAEIEKIVYDPFAEDIPVDLHLVENAATNELEDSTSELDGAIWFVSLLTRVDGLVLLSPDLEVRAFGVEILETEPPKRVVRSTTARATPGSLEPVDYEHFGTRHRSMLRYCYHVPGSLGIVVSQDGDVRVITRRNDSVVIWDSVRLQYDEFAPNTVRGSVRSTKSP
jgi:hypothetical protein